MKRVGESVVMVLLQPTARELERVQKLRHGFLSFQPHGLTTTPRLLSRKEPAQPSIDRKKEGTNRLTTDATVPHAAALFLHRNGHEVRSAHDGPGALQAVIDFNPKRPCCDIGLPGTDGYEFAPRLR